MSASRQRQVEWFNKVLDSTGLSAAKLAEKARIDASTLYKFQSGENQLLRERTWRRIVAVTGAAPPETLAGLAEGDAVPFNLGDLPAIDLPDVDQPKLFALMVKSNAMEKAGVAPGDILVFDTSLAAEGGDIVCAQVVDYRLGTAETIIRLYETPFLVALSDDRTHVKPLIVDNERVQIRGVAVRQVRVKEFRSVA